MLFVWRNQISYENDDCKRRELNDLSTGDSFQEEELYQRIPISCSADRVGKRIHHSHNSGHLDSGGLVESDEDLSQEENHQCGHW